MFRETCGMEQSLLTYITIPEVATAIAIGLQLIVIAALVQHDLLALQGMQLVFELAVRGYLQEGEQQCMLHLKRPIGLKHKEITVKPMPRKCPTQSIQACTVFQP